MRQVDPGSCNNSKTNFLPSATNSHDNALIVLSCNDFIQFLSDFVSIFVHPMALHKFSILILLSVSIFSCNTTRYLSPEQALLKQNKIKISGISSEEANFRLKEQILPLQKQKPNKNFLLVFPREWFYFKAKARENKDSWITKTLEKYAEAPSLLDSLACESTRKNFINYMYNLGYFKADANFVIKIKNKKAKVTYTLNTGPRYYINELTYTADDSTIQNIVRHDAENSLLSAGTPLDYNMFQQEKARLSELLYNQGYIEFSPIYIEPLLADTIHLKANLNLHIRNPGLNSPHTKYSIYSVRVNTNYQPSARRDSMSYEIYDSLNFVSLQTPAYILPSILAEKIKIRPDQIARKDLIDETYTNLYKLGTYRFINIEGKIDTQLNNQIQYNILLSPNKKWVFDFGADLNYTSIRQARKTLFGISGFVHLKNRNLFRRAASLSTKLEVGTELDLLQLSDFNSLNIHYSNELSLASFYDFTRSWTLFKFLTKPVSKVSGEPDSRTNIKIGVDYENLVSLYKYTAFNTGIEYDWQIKKRKRFTLKTFGFSLYLPKTTSSFDTLLSNNKFLKESFTNSRLFSSLFLDNLTFYYQSQLKSNRQHSLITSFNISGLEVSALNSIYNKVFNKNSTFAIGEFEFSKFIKTDFDYRFYTNFSDKSKLAMRFATGIIVPFGNSSSVPYIKQFFVGGPQSLRAWNLREIGPGSLNLADSVQSENPTYFSAGDFKLETSIEYRFDMFWRFKGALFLDAGNIWYLPKASGDNDKSGFLTSNFLKEIAIGTGIGIRLDLTYFLFRVDCGFQIKNAYPDQNGNYWIYNSTRTVSLGNLFENSTIHLALDYPF
ncbi:MAG: BamA/TamA family outer membrane protein [Saprospiraceae bacterium]|nr:BamA/TamA family outer membrane protein [Saprospiraceae bacterium]